MLDITSREQLRAQLECSNCGATVEAACACGAAYTPQKRAIAAINANPKKSDREIARDVGVGHATVSRARKATATVSAETVEKRIGKDRKARRLPKRDRSWVPPIRMACTEHLRRPDGSVDADLEAFHWAIDGIHYERMKVNCIELPENLPDQMIVSAIEELDKARAALLKLQVQLENKRDQTTEPVKAINTFHRKTVGFYDEFSRQFQQWYDAEPLLDKDGKATLMQALYLCADGFAELAQKLDGR